MTVVLSASADIDLETVHRVAWQGEDVKIVPEALVRIDERRHQFEAFVDANSTAHLYGVTTRHHYGAATLLDDNARVEYHRRLPPAPPSVGRGLPDRLIRAIILARLASFLDGHGGVRADVVSAIVAMLDAPLPYVPERGHGDPGEIIVLGHLFRHLEAEVEFGVGGSMPLINGSPCAAAALADIVLANRERVLLAEEVFALAANAIGAPMEHYHAALAPLWGDEFNTASLARMSRLLSGGTERRRKYQAPVSFRSTPRLLGWVRRLQAQGEECANVSLRAVTGNPIFIFPEDSPPLGAIYSNGSYHNPVAAPLLNAFARTWADLATLATHQVQRLVEDPGGPLAENAESRTTLLYMTQTGWAEEARQAAQPTLISLGGVRPTDTSTPDLLAWRLACEAGTAMEVTLATLAIVAAHAIERSSQRPPQALAVLHAQTLDALPSDADPNAFADGLARLTNSFAQRVFGGSVVALTPALSIET
jgi:histidine ammonia-lyase